MALFPWTRSRMSFPRPNLTQKHVKTVLSLLKPPYVTLPSQKVKALPLSTKTVPKIAPQRELVTTLKQRSWLKSQTKTIIKLKAHLRVLVTPKRIVLLCQSKQKICDSHWNPTSKAKRIRSTRFIANSTSFGARFTLVLMLNPKKKVRRVAKSALLRF